MRAFLEPLRSMEEISRLEAQLKKEPGIRMISGCIDSQKPHLMYGIGSDFQNKIIVTFHEQRAREIYEEYLFFDKSAVYYSAKDILFYQSDLRGNVLTRERISALRQIAEQNKVTLVTTYDALMNRMPGPEKFIRAVRNYSVGDEIDLEQFRRKLTGMGYEAVYQVETAGQFAIRGGIIDVFPLTEENPYRMELWGDEIDSLRSFDVESQRSIENMESIEIYPAAELILTDREKDAGVQRIREDADRLYHQYRKEMKTEEAARIKQASGEILEEILERAGIDGIDAYLTYFDQSCVSLLDYFEEKNTLIFLDEAGRCTERGRMTEQEFSESMKLRLEKGYILPGQMEALFTCEETAAKLQRRRCVSLAALEVRGGELAPLSCYGISA